MATVVVGCMSVQSTMVEGTNIMQIQPTRVSLGNGLCLFLNGYYCRSIVFTDQ